MATGEGATLLLWERPQPGPTPEPGPTPLPDPDPGPGDAGSPLPRVARLFPVAGTWQLELAVDRAPVPGGGALLLAAALGEAAATGVQRLHYWIRQPDEEADHEATAAGFVAERRLLQLRVPLPLPAARHRGEPVPVRPFVPSRDEEAWLTVNNRAFAGHPEQGGWDLATLRRARGRAVVRPRWLPAGRGGRRARRVLLVQDPSRARRPPGRDLRDRRGPGSAPARAGPGPHGGRTGLAGGGGTPHRDALRRRRQRGRHLPLPLTRVPRAPRRTGLRGGEASARHRPPGRCRRSPRRPVPPPPAGAAPIATPNGR